MVSGAGNLLNIILDLVLIFFFGLGVSGAAIATVISEYVSDVVKLTVQCHHTLYIVKLLILNFHKLHGIFY